MINELIEKIVDKKNPTVAGLDTRYEYIPDFLLERYCPEGSGFEGVARAILEFNKSIIDAICDHVPAVKVQIAYYELYGLPGLDTFNKTVAYAKEKGLIVIGDIKRNDIGPTAEAYSAAFLGKTNTPDGKLHAFNVDFATVNPYFGIDGIKPFIEDSKKYNKGIFILVKTSNPSSGDIQDIETENGKVYTIVAKKVTEWGKDSIGKYGYSFVGAVVGATYPKQLTELRESMPHSYILIPGYGAQGAGISDILGGFNKDGLGAVINASRSIICAWKEKHMKPEEFASAALSEVIRMKSEIDMALSDRDIKPW